MLTIIAIEPNIKETIVYISSNELYPFKEHPFKVKDDEDMKKIAQSVKDIGILNPLLVRTRESGGYEIVSGHRRFRAAQLSNINAIPCLIRELDDESAVILMVDSNLQREKILPSEKAWAYKMKLEALKRKAGRPNKNKKESEAINTAGKRSNEIVAIQVGESVKQVQRYIRLTELLPELLEKVDKREIAFNPAVEISFLDKAQQKDFLDAMEYSQSTPSLAQAQKIKRLASEKKLSKSEMNKIMSEEKKKDINDVILKGEVIKRYFPGNYTPKQMEQKILEILDKWKHSS